MFPISFAFVIKCAQISFCGDKMWCRLQCCHLLNARRMMKCVGVAGGGGAFSPHPSCFIAAVLQGKEIQNMDRWQMDGRHVLWQLHVNWEPLCPYTADSSMQSSCMPLLPLPLCSNLSICDLNCPCIKRDHRINVHLPNPSPKWPSKSYFTAHWSCLSYQLWPQKAHVDFINQGLK